MWNEGRAVRTAESLEEGAGAVVSVPADAVDPGNEGKLVHVSEQLGGVHRVALQMTNPRLAHDDLLRGIELLGTEVAPRVAQV